MPGTDAFDDADDLDPPDSARTDAELVAILASLFRADVSGLRPEAVRSTVAASSSQQRARVLLALADALANASLVAWIEERPERVRRAVEIARSVAPPDPEAAHNAAVSSRLRAHSEWDAFDYRLLVVPGYTPPGETVARAGVHPVARRRLEMAAEDLHAGRAPFILVSGANVYPRGTPYFEAIEMKKALCAMGVPADRILVDARARHTTTNLRNAGRVMRALGIPKALIVTAGGGVAGSDFFGQDFYLANPTLSTFHLRCERELGYRVGQLSGLGSGRIELVPSEHVDRLSYRDPLDP